MKKILDDIRDGTFAREWMDEYESGGSRFKALTDADQGTHYDEAGRAVRSFMPWLKKP